MSAVGNYYHSNVGRMFARQNVPSVYGVQKKSAAGTEDAAVKPTDLVSLSSQAPKPLPAKDLEDAFAVGSKLAAGDSAMSTSDSDRLREDRVFAAVSALAMLGYDGESGMQPGWPGGIPAPTAEELDAARRRLAQRPQNPDEVGDVDGLMKTRQSILSAVGRTDFMGISLTA